MNHPPTRKTRSLGLLCAIAVVAGLIVSGPAAQGSNIPHDAIVSANPANFTPNVLDGEIYAFAQIGSRIFAAGQFTQVQAASGGPVFARSNLFSFDATTGAIDAGFAPTFDDSVKAIAVGPDGNLFAGGFFNAVNGDTTARKVVKLNPNNGQRIAAFSANTNGQVWDIEVWNNRLLVGGRFTMIKSVARDRLAAVDLTTGAVDSNVSFSITESRSPTTVEPWVYAFDVSPDGSQLVIIGNFMKVNGESRPQVAMIDLSTSPASLADWQTDRYAHPCFANAFVTYMRDVDFSPDSSYFVIASTGGPNVGTLCDTAARWDSDVRGSFLEPEWVNVSGGDTLWGLAVTGAAVYVGGHQRWMNNYYGVDNPGPGAVDRPGIAALDPVNGMPFSWNPTRDRGKAVYTMMATTSGLWVGSDTDRIGGETHRKIAFFPLAGGTTPPTNNPYTLPGDLFNVPASTCQGGDPSILYRVNAGGPGVGSADCGPDWMADDSDGAPGAARRNNGSNPASWGQQFTVDGSVPNSTPSAIFDSERWDPGDAPEMQWNFPVPAGTNLRVRLYLINQCGCTSGVGQRAFDVAIDGNTVLNDYDIVADVGDRVGTMKAFDITSDGSVNIDFGHVVENSLVNGIEIIDRDIPPTLPGDIDFLGKRSFDGAAVGPHTILSTPGTDWASTRGAFALQGTVYSGSTDGNFYQRSFDGTSFGPAQSIPLNGLNDFPVQNLTGMFYADGRVYYTVQGDPRMFYRYFTPESGIVGSFRFTVANCPTADPSILYRVNAGGPGVGSADCGPDWMADDSDGAPGAARRNNGSNPASWGQQFTVDGSVPNSTPSAIFDSERWDPGDAPEMQWNFPVPAGTNLRVRLYLINQCGCTSGVGQRAFDVAIDGNTVLNDYDIVADVGDRVGTMKAFDITSDGSVNIDFGHVVENSLVNGIEIIDRDAPVGPSGLADWSNVRGLTLADGHLYYARTDGNLYSTDFSNGSPAPGTEQLVSPATDGYDWASRGLFVFKTVVDGDPSVTVTSPNNGATVSGVVNVTANATDTEGIAQVEFKVDGTSIGVDTNGGNGWSASWDTTTHPAGAATVSATATDTANKTAIDSVTVTVDNSSPGTVAMVVADPNSLLAGETAVRNRLTNAGYSVTVINDDAMTAADANGTVFVFVSSTANANVVGTKLRTVVQPVWMAKPYLLDDMLMTGPVADVDYGSLTSASIVISDAGHPLAGGQSGTVTITTSNHGKSFGLPGAGADVVATAGGRPTTFVYQAGDQLVGGTTAPGCRLTSSAFQNGPANFTAAGWAMFEAAANYAANNCQAGPPPPDGDPSVTVTSPNNGATVSGVVNVTANATDTEGIAQVEFKVDGTSIGVDTNGGNGWSASWDTTTHPAGAATVSATATDTANKTAIDSVTVTVDNSSPGTVAMVVADPNSLLAGETAVRNRLTNAGYSVTVINDDAMTAADANGTVFVFVSSTANANVVGTKLRTVVQPVWMAKPYLLDDMLMTGPVADVDYGSLTSASIVISDAGHPLAGGQSGTVTITTSNHGKSFGLPGAGADVVATAGGRPTTFVYQAGDQLVGGTTAPGCRLTSSAFQNGPANFTAAGWAMFEAAANYAANNCQA